MRYSRENLKGTRGGSWELNSKFYIYGGRFVKLLMISM